MTNFKNVWELNKSFNRPQTNKEEQDFDKLLNQFALVVEEVAELKEALETGNWEEVKDAIGDILVVTYGMGYVANIDCDKLMDNISKSNFSKFCNHAQMVKTMEHYTELGVDVVAKETMINGKSLYAVKSAADQTYTVEGVDKTIKNGKLLKNMAWIEPDLNVEY